MPNKKRTPKKKTQGLITLQVNDNKENVIAASETETTKRVKIFTEYFKQPQYQESEEFKRNKLNSPYDDEIEEIMRESDEEPSDDSDSEISFGERLIIRHIFGVDIGSRAFPIRNKVCCKVVIRGHFDPILTRKAVMINYDSTCEMMSDLALIFSYHVSNGMRYKSGLKRLGPNDRSQLERVIAKLGIKDDPVCANCISIGRIIDAFCAEYAKFCKEFDVSGIIRRDDLPKCLSFPGAIALIPREGAEKYVRAHSGWISLYYKIAGKGIGVDVKKDDPWMTSFTSCLFDDSERWFLLSALIKVPIPEGVAVPKSNDFFKRFPWAMLQITD